MDRREIDRVTRRDRADKKGKEVRETWVDERFKLACPLWLTNALKENFRLDRTPLTSNARAYYLLTQLVWTSSTPVIAESTCG